MTMQAEQCRKALMICPHYWDSPIQVGTHHLARGIVDQGWEVGFISPPVTPFHLLTQKWQALEARVANCFRGGVRDLDGRLWAYNPASLLVPKSRGFFDSDMVYRHWHKTIFPGLSSKLSQEGFDPVDLLYFETPLMDFLLDEVSYRKSVFRVADNYHGFGVYPPKVLKAIENIAQRVDLVVYSAQSLADYVAGLGAKKSLHLPNGVQFEHFASPRDEGAEDLARFGRPVAIYVGSIENWFDFELLDRAAVALPGVSFVVIGPDSPCAQKIKSRANVHFLGPRPFKDIPAYLQRADVGLIPFDVQSHAGLLDYVNPLKLYEYFACGLPVVSTRWRELELLNTPAKLADDADGFIAAIESSLQEEGGREALVSFAREFDWGDKAREFLENCVAS